MVPVLALLVGLGIWQLQRLQWKLDLIAAMNRNMHAAPVSVGQALAMGLANAEYHRISLTGRFLNARESYVFATGPDGAPVYHVLTPLVADDGRTFLIDRGIVPPALRSPAMRASGELSGEQTILGVLRVPGRPGLFTPAPDLVHNVWFSRDLTGIARADRVKLAIPALVEADATPNPGGWPRGGQTLVNLPNDHLQYAITWFLLATALVVVYFAYHRARGRFSFDVS